MGTFVGSGMGKELSSPLVVSIFSAKSTANINGGGEEGHIRDVRREENYDIIARGK